VNQQVLRDTMLEARDEGRTVIFSTHNMEQAEQLCEHVCIIAQGRKVLDGRLRDVQRANRGNRFAVEFEETTDAVRRFMAEERRFGEFSARGEGWSIELAPGTDQRELMRAVAALDAPVARFEHEQPSLHDIFVAHVGDAATPHRVREAAHV
jgi:ABC-2 type transport system ATP-binding protein